jgi:Holliday junction resolvasome RuvABC endonuclease subunit
MIDIAYVGFDCSSKAIHGVVMDENLNIIAQHKWASKEKTFEKRFPEFATNFCKDLSKIILNLKREKVEVAIEQAVFIQNPRTTVEIANVIGCVRTACYLQSFNVKVVDNTK